MLQDLDELVLKCRDERARAYIREAVLCFKAGAYRSAIVSTWIAVAFDIIDKIRELSLSGDKQAVQFIQSYEAATEQNAIDTLLRIEQGLLTTAKDNFELISQQEHIELERLRDDRNRCAHPSRSTFDQIFSPPAELARLHIRTAVDSLLQHEPTQGKAALDRLKDLISLSHFPIDASRALIVLEASPLKRARISLVRNLLIAALKASLNPATKYDQRERLHAVIKCIKTMHPEAWEKIIREELTRLFETVTDSDRLYHAIQLLTLEPELPQALDSRTVTMLQQLLLSPLKVERSGLAADAMAIPALRESAKKAIAKMGVKELGALTLLSNAPTPYEAAARAVSGYSNATSFETGNAWSELVLEMRTLLTPDDIRKILHAAATNGQLYRNYKTPKVLDALRAENKIPPDEFKKLQDEIPPEWT